ncbi:ABC transporter C family member 8 [Spatholobus suberectus]|nr:ABC transporter C family member 8 [Spatholobus suberectus]
MLRAEVMNLEYFSVTGYAVDFSWTCLRHFDFTSLCSQRSIIDIFKLLFIGVFYMSLLITLIRRRSACGSHRKNWVFSVVSVCCALISIAHLSNGLKLWNQQSWLACIFRAFVWLSFTVSLHVQRYKWIKILSSIWWASSCVLASALNIEIMFKEHAVEVFEMVQWLVHFLLFFCAFQNLGCFVTSQHIKDTTTLSEPLIAQRVETTQTRLGHATLISKLTFSWVNSLLRLGYSKPLALEDIPFLLSEDKAASAYQDLAQAWESLVRESSNNNTKNSVLWSVVRTFSKENILIAFYALLRSICMIVSPLILYAFVNYSNSSEADLKVGFSMLGFLILTKVVESMSQRHYCFGSRRSGMKIRSALMVAVYQKLLKLSSSARKRHSTGEVVNYIAVDAYRLGEFPWWFHVTWTSVVQLVLSIVLLFCVVGAGALPGLVPLLICGLLNVPFAKIIQNSQSQFMMAQDERLRSTSEILNSMKIIKLQSWEDKFKNIVLSLRAKEIIWLSKAQIIKAYGSFLYWMVPTIVPSSCVMTTLREKTVILVTHQVEFLSEVDQILVMEGGKITQSGSYEDLLTAGTAFEQLVSAHKAALTELDQESENNRDSDIEVMIHPEEFKNQREGVISTKGQLGVQLTQEEEKEIGDVGWKPFWDYISFSRGSFLLCLTMSAQFAFIALQTASTYWLALASEILKVTSVTFIGVYSLFSLVSIVFIYIRSVLAANLGLKASKAFFSSFTSAIFNAPMLFFDSTPVGRILTRASSDLSIVDLDIPYTLFLVAFVVAEILVTICVMASVTWQVLIVAVPAMVASIYIQVYYQASARELMRINGTTKAPVMNFAAETSLGVVTVRALNTVNRFFNNYLKLVDMDATLFFHSNVAMEWSILRIEVLQNLTVFTAALLLILLPKGYVPSGLVGFSLSYAFTLKESLVFWSRMFSMLSNHIISVERIKQFIHIPAEPPAIVEDNRPPSSWPSKGRIDLRALEALEKCQLKETISKLPGLLDSSVSDEGGNWSLGQRQLFCLGRVLLKRNRILVLDEATASIDSATDAILQQVIRQEFAECTVITVAHRVPTVIDSDMVMVLSYGKLVEYDEPSKLMGINSMFSKLVAEYWSSCSKNSSLPNITRQQH